MRIKDDSKIKNILKIVSPGTNLREGLENILRAKTGGLIVLSDNEEVMKIVDGGFYNKVRVYSCLHIRISKNGWSYSYK